MSEKITWSPNETTQYISLGEENLQVIALSQVTGNIRTTDYKNNGKWYWEIYVGENANPSVGITKEGKYYDRGGVGNGIEGQSFAFTGNEKKTKGVGLPYSNKQIRPFDSIGIFVDFDEGIIEFSLNGDRLGVAFNTITKGAKYSPAIGIGRIGVTSLANFGATPFKHFSQDLKDKGYLPYDIDNAHEDNIPLKHNKYLFRYSKEGRLYQPTPEGMVLLEERDLTKELLEEKGTEDITDIVGVNKVIEEVGQEGENCWEFEVIPETAFSFTNIRLEEV